MSDNTDSGDVEKTDDTAPSFKGFSKAFNTSIENKSGSIKSIIKVNAVGEKRPLKQSQRKSIRVPPNEFLESDELKYRKIATRGVVKLFNLMNKVG